MVFPTAGKLNDRSMVKFRLKDIDNNGCSAFWNKNLILKKLSLRLLIRLIERIVLNWLYISYDSMNDFNLPKGHEWMSLI